ncbi:MAG: 1-acyl-sn-glycerol-3-phosphate acyltransferase [Bacteroidetes bacterium]|nr:1-acyl-sn-glycerol-3-phosphate acyltransferase [Bacteroidota bacterium]
MLYPFFYFSLKSKKYNTVHFLKNVWSRIIVWGSLIFPVIKYKDKKYQLPVPCIVVSNHTSYLDIIISFFYVKKTAIYLGKQELLKTPLFNIFFKYMDIPVNRKSITESHKALIKCGEKIDKGFNIVIYPEGTISSNGKLKKFKNGAFKLAIDKQVDIVPVANINNWKFLQNGGFFKSKGTFGIPKIVVGSPISTKGLTENDIELVKEKCFNFIQLELTNYYGAKN